MGIIAIGHSGLTGEGTVEPGVDAPENSWATGTAPEVDSVYLRLVAARPETLGHVANTAEGGAAASPNSKILIVGQLGRPDAVFTKQFLAQLPSLIPTSPPTGMCDFVDENANITQSHLETLTAIVDQYEAEETRVCAAVPQCRTDGRCPCHIQGQDRELRRRP